MNVKKRNKLLKDEICHMSTIWRLQHRTFLYFRFLHYHGHFFLEDNIVKIRNKNITNHFSKKKKKRQAVGQLLERWFLIHKVVGSRPPPAHHDWDQANVGILEESQNRFVPKSFSLLFVPNVKCPPKAGRLFTLKLITIFENELPFKSNNGQDRYDLRWRDHVHWRTLLHG